MEKTAIETGIQGRIINVSSIGHQLLVKPYGIKFESINDQSRYFFFSFSYVVMVENW